MAILTFHLRVQYSWPCLALKPGKKTYWFKTAFSSGKCLCKIKLHPQCPVKLTYVILLLVIIDVACFKHLICCWQCRSVVLQFWLLFFVSHMWDLVSICAKAWFGSKRLELIRASAACANKAHTLVFFPPHPFECWCPPISDLLWPASVIVSARPEYWCGGWNHKAPAHRTALP